MGQEVAPRDSVLPDGGLNYSPHSGRSPGHSDPLSSSLQNHAAPHNTGQCFLVTGAPAPLGVLGVGGRGV